MYVMRKLPALLALIVGVIITISGIYQESNFKEISGRLVIGLLLFYTFGVIIKNNFFNYLVHTLEDAEKKNKELKEMEYSRLMGNEGQQQLEEELEPYIPRKL